MNLKAFLIAMLVTGAVVFCRADDVAVSSAPIEVEVSTAVAAPEPFVWPVAKKIQGKPVAVVSKFGNRKSPVDGVEEMHEGVDFAVPSGASVKAARSGKVLFAGFSKSYAQRADKKQQNRLVIVRHVDGTSTRYVHLATLKVRPPQDIKAGDLLGTADGSDEWTTAVLHFEIRDAGGKALDPMKIFAEGGLIP